MALKTKDVFWIIVGIGVIGFFLFKVFRKMYVNDVLDNKATIVKAIIIYEKNYMGNQPVNPKFSYSYQFKIEGKKYTGNVHDNSLIVGDTIEVLYDRNNPNINKPLNPKD